MSSSSTPKKRTKRSVVEIVVQEENGEAAYLERWFSRN